MSKKNPGVIQIALFLTACFYAGVENMHAQDKVIVSTDDAAKNYQIFCASCHGINKEKFQKEAWLYGDDEMSISESIKNGRLDVGMPSFDAAFSAAQIDALAGYVKSSIDLLVDATPKPSSSIISSEVQKFIVDTIVTGVGVPWGMEFLPDGRLIISDRTGTMHLFANGELSEPLAGVPEVLNRQQGGLLDIKLHPDYANNKWIYFAYSRPATADKNDGGSTAIMRARLNGLALVDQEIIFTAQPVTRTLYHYGCRIVFDKDGYMYFSVGERAQQENAQKLESHNGKIHRLHDDGRIPDDNPFVSTPEAKASIFSYGHRNPQGMAIHPTTGEVWSHEHGPRGGDEINIIKKGANYGWPKITFGINYNGTIITEDTARVGMEQPVHYYVPSIAPCGMDFVVGDKYPNWKGNILIGSLSFKYLERVVLDGNKVSHQEKLLENIGRVRNVKMSPDGYIYVSIENPGKILKLIPVNE